jgi:pyruvate dehydrogenase E2 component (dihydrolipoamide acetyltransferase)
MTEIAKLPKLGLSGRGELTQWKVEVGDEVAAGDAIATLESEKATAEVESPADGVLLLKYVDEGEEIDIEVGTPIAAVGEAGEEPPAVEDIEAPGETTAAEPAETETEEPAGPGPSPGEPTEGIKASPRARDLAESEGVNLARIDGTGPGGAITEADVAAQIEAGGAAPETKPARGVEDLTVVEETKLSGLRKTIADRLSQSAREKPHAMGTRDIRIEPLQAVKEELAAEVDVEISLNDLIIAALAKTLEDIPEFNAHFQDGTHTMFEEQNIGYAVDGPRGLVVPVIRNVGALSLEEIAQQRDAVVQKVLDDEFTPEDLAGGTFTVTNVGVFDTDVSFSIINPPQVAVLAIGRRKLAPFERDGEIDFERVTTFSIVIDHRPLDGADAGRFMDELASNIESPGWVRP